MSRLSIVWRTCGALAAVVFALAAYIYVTLPDVRALATENPTTTAFMRLRQDEAVREGKTARHVQQWVPYARISPNLKRAVLVAEDDAFFEHEGVDLKQFKLSIEANLARGRAVRGASTITQQLAKNLYLSPSRDPLRKVREWIIARRLETALTKVRIFEIYLNVIEWGDGIWGAEAAARRYFGVSAASLTPSQAALLAGAIINPRVYSPASPNRRLKRRQAIVLARMGGAERAATSLDDEEDELRAKEPPAMNSVPEPPVEEPSAPEPSPEVPEAPLVPQADAGVPDQVAVVSDTQPQAARTMTT